jgi:hypothetical protein
MRVTRSLILAILAVCALGAGAQTANSRLDYPLALHTRWTYHLRQEIGQGAQFNDGDAKLAKGNVFETTVVSEAAGVETIGARQYTRVESRRNGKPSLFEWDRVGPEGLLVEKSIDYSGDASETILDPEQLRLSGDLRAGNSWVWQSKDGSTRVVYTVTGAGSVEIPLGRFQGTQVKSDGTVEAPFGTVDIHQDTWFVPGVGLAKQDTTTSVQQHLLLHTTLTLEKLEKP